MMTPTPEKCDAPGASSKSLTTGEILYWAEFSCWTAIVLWPFLYWVNGAAVSTDQFVVRTGLVVLSVSGVITLRVTKILRSRTRDMPGYAEPVRGDRRLN